MRKKYIFGKKLYISILTMIVVLLTTVATTFAWVGVFANSTFDTFDINILASHFSEYSIEISLDGIHFSDEISFNDIKKQILINWGYSEATLTSQDRINTLFNTLKVDQATTIPVVENNKIVSLGQFTDLLGEETKKIYKFDFYISASKTYDKEVTSSFNMDVYLDKNVITGNYKSYQLQNSFIYPDTYINQYSTILGLNPDYLPHGITPIEAGTIITKPKVNSADAARIAFEKYPVVAKGHPELYTSETEPKSALIYHNSYDFPIYNEEDNAYSFGSIVPDDYNLAVGYYNSTEYFYYKYKIKSVSVPNDILNTRSVDGVVPDLKLSSQTNQLIDSNDTNEQVGINTMIKIKVYFWFEGWDADCFPVINLSPVNIKIGLNMKNDEVF